MNVTSLRSRLTAIFGAVLFSTIGLAEVPAAAREVHTATEVEAAQWSDIKDASHEMRARFFTGLDRLEAKVDGQIRALASRRAAMKATTDTREWDFTMKEMSAARSYLQAVALEAHTATRENWDQEKDKVGRAWTRTQDIHAKVKSSTTS